MGSGSGEEQLAWYKFCRVSTEEWHSKLPQLAEMTHGREWRSQTNVLAGYIIHTFETCHRQEKLEYFERPAPQSGMDADKLLCFNTGLVTYNYWEVIVCVFIECPAEERSWKLLGFERESEVRSWGFTRPLHRAVYFDDPSALVLDLRNTIDPNFPAVLARNPRALKASTLRPSEDLGTKLYEAFRKAMLMCKVNYRTPVPQYSYDLDPSSNRLEGSMGFLLPLYISDKPAPDLVLKVVRVIEPSDVSVVKYVGVDLYTTEVAYRNARLLGKVESEWLQTALTWLGSGVQLSRGGAGGEAFHGSHSRRSNSNETPRALAGPLLFPDRHHNRALVRVGCPLGGHANFHALGTQPPTEAFQGREADFSQLLGPERRYLNAHVPYVDGEIIQHAPDLNRLYSEPFDGIPTCGLPMKGIPTCGPPLWRAFTPTPPGLTPSPVSSPSPLCEERPGVVCLCPRPDHYYSVVRLTDAQRTYIRYIVVTVPFTPGELYTIGIRFVCETQGAQQLLKALEGNLSSEYKKGAQRRICKPFDDPEAKKTYQEKSLSNQLLSGARGLLGSTIFGIFMTVGLHMWKGMIVGLAIQSIMAPFNLYENPLVQTVLIKGGFSNLKEKRIFNEKLREEISEDDHVTDDEGNTIVLKQTGAKGNIKGGNDSKKNGSKSFEDVLLDTWDLGEEADIATFMSALTKSNINNATKENAWTPIMIMSGLGASGVVEALRKMRELGANPEIVDKEGWNALHWAAFHGSADAAKALLSKDEYDGITLGLHLVADKEGKAPLDLAKDEKNDDVAKVINEAAEYTAGLDTGATEGMRKRK